MGKANTAASRKAKGRRLQQQVCDQVLKLFENVLETDDIKPAIMGESGTDVKLSPLARKLFPYSVECKNVEALNIWKALSQAELNAKENTDPLLIFKRNHSKTYAVLEFDTFLNIVKELSTKK